ncbi:MAG: NADH:ubiquinone oxidoreductase subunit NDUFA12 [Inquilinaceae bacterium]
MGFSLHEWGLRSFIGVLTSLRGKQIGKDEIGNRYFVDPRSGDGRGQRRWVMYAKGESEASRVPPEWHGWLHHQTDLVPGEGTARRPWQKDHVPNMTGTLAAYRPPGHTLKGGTRAKATGDYEPWTPS